LKINQKQADLTNFGYLTQMKKNIENLLLKTTIKGL